MSLIPLKKRAAVSVEVKGLSKHYEARPIFQNLTLRVEPGEIFVLMGPSGAGKSVFLKTLMGLEAPDSGVALVDGRDVADPETRMHHVMGVVFQAGALFNSMSVFDNLALYPREHNLYTETVLEQKVRRILKLLAIEHAADYDPSALSGGMKKRVAIARALVMEPQLLLYDEPTSELDPETGAMIAEIIATLREEIGVTSIVVSHDIHMALAVADRIGILMDGVLRTLGTPAELRQCTDPRIQSFLNPKINPKNPRFRCE